jgi:ubiquinol-cytochrome c reductase cytochrome c subunit
MNKTIALAITLVVALAWTPAKAEDAPPKGNAQTGKTLFEKDGCYQCHGYIGQGASATGPRLAPEPLPYDAYLRQLRTPAQDMPPYESAILTDQQAADIYAYLMTIKKGPDPKSIPLLNN